MFKILKKKNHLKYRKIETVFDFLVLGTKTSNCRATQVLLILDTLVGDAVL